MGDIVKCVLLFCSRLKPYFKARDSVALKESLRWRTEGSCHRRKFNKDVKARSLFDRFRFSRLGTIFSCAFVLLLFLRSPFVSSPFRSAFLKVTIIEAFDWCVNFVWRHGLEHPLPSRQSIKRPLGSRRRQGQGIEDSLSSNMMRKWAMTWEVEWESINVECDVRVGCWEVWRRDRRKWICTAKVLQVLLFHFKNILFSITIDQFLSGKVAATEEIFMLSLWPLPWMPPPPWLQLKY